MRGGGDPLVVLIGPFGFEGGFGEHARSFAGALAARLEVVTCDAKPDMADMLAAAADVRARHAAGRPVVSIAIGPTNIWKATGLFPGPRIGFLAWETTRIPEHWHPILGGMDRVWTPTAWGRDVLVENGVPAAAIDVVPEGVDTGLFHPAGDTFASVTADPRVKFLSVGKFESRKCSVELIEAFAAEFTGEEAVLLLSCRPDNDRDELLLQRVLKGRERQVRRVGWVGSRAEMARLYRSCDAFVMPTRGEGWGLPVIEAMASGLPTIVTGWSGPTAFAHPGNALLLDHRLVRCPIPRFAFGDWAEPDIAHLRTLMRRVADDLGSVRPLGATAAKEMAERFTWDAAAARGAERIAALLGEAVS
jgi:glycosyltransferase involved in cell wall biosynthesis